MTALSGGANAAIHPPGSICESAQVLDERGAEFGRVESLVRPPARFYHSIQPLFLQAATIQLSAHLIYAKRV